LRKARGKNPLYLQFFVSLKESSTFLIQDGFQALKLLIVATIQQKSKLINCGGNFRSKTTDGALF
jgi:hypothetical protein